MPHKFTPSNGDDLIRRYQAGKSLKYLAEEYGVSRAPIKRFLELHGVPVRSVAAATQLSNARRTPEERRAYAEAAHTAIRGSRQSVEHRTRIAATRELRQLGVSPTELLLAEWLSDLNPIPQKAISRYNVDLAVGAVAVEVFGGHWYAYGRHAARTEERARYILDQGWLLVIIWLNREHRLQRDVAEYVRALHDAASGDPSLRGQYRVVWGDGQDVTGLCADVDQLSVVPTGGRRSNTRT